MITLCGHSLSREFLCCHIQSHPSAVKHLSPPCGVFFPSVWVLRHISRFKNALNLNTPSLSERLHSWQLKMSIQPLNWCRWLTQLLVSLLCVVTWKTGWMGERGCVAYSKDSTGLLAVHLSSQLVVALSASHICTVGICTVNQWVLDYDGVARVMTEGTYTIVVD